MKASILLRKSRNNYVPPILLIIVIVSFQMHLFSPSSHSEELQLEKGWNQENLNQAIKGCTYGMLNPNLESYRQRALNDGHQVNDDEMQKVKNILFPLFYKTCKCIIEKTSQKWSFEECSKNPSEVDQYMNTLIMMKECPLPALPK